MTTAPPSTPADPTRPLHDAFPLLASKLPYVPLASLPTPLVHATGPAGPVMIKRDGLTHPTYGGNKVRKLEYLLGQALSHGCQHVATFGAAGSNHATATAIHANALGLGCISFLSRQRQTPWVANNLRLQIQAGARIVFVDGDRAQREQQARDVIRQTGGKTWLIPMGGSSLAGTIGYVNAGFELAQQLDQGEFGRPESIYVPLGTMGTVVGLLAGLMAAGIAIPVIAVRVVHQTIGADALMVRLFEHTVRLLRRLDPSFPQLDFAAAPLICRHDQFGQGYAHATDAAKQAQVYAQEHWDLTLETTYSGKTVAALLADCQVSGAGPSMKSGSEQSSGQPLYWATYSDAHSVGPAPSVDPGQLPSALRQYLTED